MHGPLNDPEDFVDFELNVLKLLGSPLTPPPVHPRAPWHFSERKKVFGVFLFKEVGGCNVYGVQSVGGVGPGREVPRFDNRDLVCHILISSDEIGGGTGTRHNRLALLRKELHEDLAVNIFDTM